MYVDTGNGYEFLTSQKDYLNVIRRRISYEFMTLIENEFDAVNHEIEAMKKGDFNYIEMENEELRTLIDDTNSELQHYLVELEKGKRINRQTLINLLNRITQNLSDR